MSIIVREFVAIHAPKNFTRVGAPFRAGGQVHYVALHEACGRHVVLRGGASGKHHCGHCRAETREATHLARLLPEDTTGCPRCGYTKPQVMARRRDRGGYRSMKCTECLNTWMQACAPDAPVSCSRFFMLDDGRRVSLQQIAESCNVSKWTISAWIKAGMSADSILAGERPQKKQKPTKRKLPRRLTELAKIAGVCVTTMRKRLKVMSPDEAVDYQPPKPIGAKPRRHLFHGKMLTAVELAHIANVRPSTIGARLRDGMTPGAAVAMGNQRLRLGIQRKEPRRWRYQGRELTALELSSVAGISLSQMRRRLAVMPVDAAVGKAKRRFIRVDPAKLAEAVSISGVGEFTIRARLRRGMTLDEAIALGHMGKGKGKRQ